MAGINLAKANQIFSSMKGAAKWTPKLYQMAQKFLM